MQTECTIQGKEYGFNVTIGRDKCNQTLFHHYKWMEGLTECEPDADDVFSLLVMQSALISLPDRLYLLAEEFETCTKESAGQLSTAGKAR